MTDTTDATDTTATPPAGNTTDTTATPPAGDTTATTDAGDTTASPTARHRATIETYLRFWNAGASEEQQRLASTVFADNVQYCALFGVLGGPPALIGFRDQFAEHMGTYAFRARREPEVHHDRARLLWQVDAHGKEPFATGTEVMAFGPDGRITTVTTFLDQAPEGFDPEAHG